jgi:hypothetical protein
MYYFRSAELMMLLVALELTLAAAKNMLHFSKGLRHRGLLLVGKKLFASMIGKNG